MGLYDNIKEACRQKNKTVTQLERELGFVRGKIAKMNDSSPSVETMAKIADKLDCSIDYLVNGTIVEHVKPLNNQDVLLQCWAQLGTMDQARILVAMDDLIKKKND